MIGPGWMPSRPRPRTKRQHPYAFSYRKARRPRVAKARRIDHDPTVLFDVEPSELPVATIVPKRTKLASVVVALEGWLAGRLSWLRPRVIPVAVAFIGMVLVLASMKHLARIASGDAQVAMQAPCVHGTGHVHATIEVRITTPAPDTGQGMRVTPPSLFHLSPLAAQALR
jgi:hypothetical protein